MKLKQFLAKVLLSTVMLSTFAHMAQAQRLAPSVPVYNAQQEKQLASVRWSQNLSDKIPLGLAFVNDQGKAVKLGDYFGAKPVILTLMYLECPMLCGEVINGTFQAMEDLKFKAGSDFEYVAVSINPKEGSKLAATKKAEYLKRHHMAPFAEGVHFLTGDQPSIKELAKAVGFHYSYDPATKTYAHPAGIVLVNGDGVISKYMGGVVFQSRDLRLGMVDSSQGKVGSLSDIILLKCSAFDPKTGKYNFAVQNLLRGGGVLILLVLGILVFTLSRNKDSDTLERDA